jgi:hypothetical protein
MLNITYAEQDAALATSIQKDVTASGLTLDHSYLLVLLSRLTLNDSTIQSAIQTALREKQRVVPVLVESGVTLPPELQSAKAIDLSGGYHPVRVIGALKRMELGEDRITRSWRLLIAMLAIVGIAFVASVWGITRGVIRFPAEEYATENARTDATLQALVGPTLQLIVPRTTDEAAGFQATLDALPRSMKSVEQLAIGTATAQAKTIATATPQP